MVRIGFSTTQSWISRAIRWFTRSKVSHAYIVFHSKEFGQDMVMEAVSSGFRVISYEQFAEENTIVKEITPKPSLAAGLKIAADWLGEPYDYRSLIGNAWVALGSWFKRSWHHPFKSDNALICSEAIARMLKAVNYPGSHVLIPDETSPDMLLKFFSIKWGK